MTRKWSFILICGTALWAMNGVWLILDTRPPLWDMTLHQVYALHYVPRFAAPAGAKLWEWSGNYPPLVHAFIALVFPIFYPTPYVSALANLPATLLLLS